MGQILIYSDNENLGRELLGGALQLGPALDLETAVCVLGKDVKNRVDGYLSRGVHKVYIAGSESEQTANLSGETLASALDQVAKASGATLILIGCTRSGKELAGRLAQKLGAGCINDVNRLSVKDGGVVCERYALGGATVSTQTVTSQVAVISVMPGAFEQASSTMPTGKIIPVELTLSPDRLRVAERRSKAADAVDIAEANTLVCVGMGLGGAEHLPQAEELARCLGGEVACTKPVATDQKWLPEARMIGLSGKKCKPQLALCVGVSGQVQFTVGIRDSKTIVAVNSDENASIFQLCDYGIVGDLYEVLPKLIAAVK